MFPPFWHAPIPSADKGELLRKKVDLLIRALHLDDLVARNRDAANADRYGTAVLSLVFSSCCCWCST